MLNLVNQATYTRRVAGLSDQYEQYATTIAEAKKVIVVSSAAEE